MWINFLAQRIPWDERPGWIIRKSLKLFILTFPRQFQKLFVAILTYRWLILKSFLCSENLLLNKLPPKLSEFSVPTKTVWSPQFRASERAHILSLIPFVSCCCWAQHKSLTCQVKFLPFSLFAALNILNFVPTLLSNYELCFIYRGLMKTNKFWIGSETIKQQKVGRHKNFTFVSNVNLGCNWLPSSINGTFINIRCTFVMLFCNNTLLRFTPNLGLKSYFMLSWPYGWCLMGGRFNSMLWIYALAAAWCRPESSFVFRKCELNVWQHVTG